MTTKFNCPHCQQRISAPSEILGTVVQCPTCAQNFTAVAPDSLENTSPDQTPSSGLRESEPNESRIAPPPQTAPPFPVLGSCIAWAAILVGFGQILGGISLTAWIGIAHHNFKPAGIIVFWPPGLLWAWFGQRLLRRRDQFVREFFLFLLSNLVLGTLFTTAPLGSSTSDRRIFAMVGLGFIFSATIFLLFCGLLVRDLRRQAAPHK